MRLIAILLASLALTACAGCGGTPQPAAAAQGAHPRLLLDAPTLRDLRARARRRTPEWRALRRVCDSYKPGRVEFPEGGNDYPDDGGIGEGYQGSGYYPAVWALGLCYQTARVADPPRARRYGRVGAELISKMATTDPRRAAPPPRDDVYGIRFYGTGLALGYDWLYPNLSVSVRARVRRVIGAWIKTYEQKGFSNDFPQGNYFAGYYVATAFTALGVDNGPISWNRWLHVIHGRAVRPYYEANLTGGGWPEGWNYGPLGVMNMSLPVLAARTAKGVDLLKGYRFPLGAGRSLVHFTWPDHVTLEDSGALYASDNPTAADPTFYSVQAAVLDAAHDDFAPYLRGFASRMRASGHGEGLGAEATAAFDFLFRRGQPERDFTELPKSYLARGVDMATMRSSWSEDAVWGAFMGGPYVNNPGNGEELFDKGSLTIVNGRKPFLVNANAALLRNTPGTDDGEQFEDKIYQDGFGNFGDDPPPRALYNVFYAGKASQRANIRAAGARTGVTAFEDSGDDVFVRSEHLEDVYRLDGPAPINRWTREVAYLRPGTFVVHDLTSVPDASVDQRMAFHLGGRPEKTGDASYDVPGAGRVHVVLPREHHEDVADVFDGGKVFRLDVHGAQARDQEWLTVFDTSPSTAIALDHGVVLRRDGGDDDAVVFAPGDEVDYRVPAADTRHVIAGLKPGAGYAVSTSRSGDEVAVRVRPGDGSTASDAGILRLRTDAAGSMKTG